MGGFIQSHSMNRSANGGDIKCYIREDVPSRQISFKNDNNDIEHFFC